MLPTYVWYPATASRGSLRPRPGSFPLVVFAHGFDATPLMYASLLRSLAAAGYVVAAPEFPISSSGRSGPPREDDIANQALDVRATISALLAAATPGGWLSATLDRREVAIVGHSDGGETVAANVLRGPDHDPRVRAAVILAGQVPTWGSLDPASIPTLVVQGNADTINPPALSRQLYGQLRTPKRYLDVLGATHMQTAAAGSDARARVVRRFVIAYLDATLRHDSHALAQMLRLGSEPGLTRLLSDV